MRVDLRPADILDLPGEIVSGHPDRHVARVEYDGRPCYLKRQHRVGWRERWRNWRAGFGWVSKCEREAKLLESLKKAGFAVPECVAVGEHDGRAFLLVEELAGVGLRDWLSDNPLSLEWGTRLAELHAGFTTPDLTAKHVFVDPLSSLALIDWQSAERRAPSLAERIQSLAALHASLVGPTPRERLRFLRAYLKAAPVAPFAEVVRSIERAAVKQSARRSIRDQRQPVDQRLVWLAGEAVCAVPDVAAVWPSPAVAPPFYDHDFQSESRVELDHPAVLLRFRSSKWSQLLAKFRGRSWRSPGATMGRVLFHLERYGIPAPRLFAFGQREPERDSFVLFEPPRGEALTEWRSHSSEINALLKQLHDAGCRLANYLPHGWLRIDRGRLLIGDPRAIRLDRKLTARARRADTARLLGEARR